MTIVAFSVIIALVALLVVGAEDIGSGHMVFANRAFSGHGTFTNKGVNVHTDTNQDQGCEGAGGMSGITNACTATSGRGPSETLTQTPVTLQFFNCSFNAGGTGQIVASNCNTPFGFGCNNIGCQSISCTGHILGGAIANCTTDNGVHLPCSFLTVHDSKENILSCTLTNTHTVPGTGITQSGGVSGG